MVKNTIAIDAMGGDNAPKSVIAGLAISSVRNPGVEYIVYGDENKLLPLLIITGMSAIIFSLIC